MAGKESGRINQTVSYVGTAAGSPPTIGGTSPKMQLTQRSTRRALPFEPARYGRASAGVKLRGVSAKTLCRVPGQPRAVVPISMSVLQRVLSGVHGKVPFSIPFSIADRIEWYRYI